MMIDLEIETTVKQYFPNLKGKSLNSIINHSSFFKSRKGTQLITEGTRHPYFYIILTGAAKFLYNKDSREVCTWFTIEDDVVGSVLTTEGHPSKETIELMEDSTFIRFNIDQLKKNSGIRFTYHPLIE